MGCGWTFPTLEEPFTIISLTYRKRHWSMCLFLFLLRAVRLVDWLLRRGHDSADASCPFALTRSRHSRADRGCPVATGLFFAPIPLPCHPPTAIDTHGGDEQPTFNRTPQNSPQGVVGGWVGCRPQQGPQESCAPVCPPITQAEGTADHKSTSSVLCFSSWNLSQQTVVFYSRGGVVTASRHMRSLLLGGGRQHFWV